MNTKIERFELGKFYAHEGGHRKMKIVGLADTHFYGTCLIGEDCDMSYHPVDFRQGDPVVGWSEISEQDFLADRTQKPLPAIAKTV